MRSTSWVCLLFLLVFSSPALAQSEPGETPVPAPVIESRTLTDQAYGFSVEAPGEGWKWTEVENPRGRSFTVEPPDGASLFFVAAADVPLPEDGGDFMKGYVQGLREPLEKSGWTVRDVRYEPSGIPFQGAYRLVMRMSSPDGEERTFFNYVVPQGRMYSLHVFATEGAEPPEFQAFAASFKLLAPPVSPEAERIRRSAVFYSYLILLGLVTGICWIVNKALGRPKLNGARIAFVLIAILALLRLLLVLGSFEAGGDPGSQGEAIGRWTAETGIALLIAHFAARRFKKKTREAALAEASVETFS